MTDVIENLFVIGVIALAITGILKLMYDNSFIIDDLVTATIGINEFLAGVFIFIMVIAVIILGAKR